MTLTELLIAICFMTTLVSATATAHHAKAGVGGYAQGIFLGLPLAFCAAAAMYRVVMRIGAATQSSPKWKENLYGCFLLMFMFLWILFSAFFADRVVSIVRHLVT